MLKNKIRRIYARILSSLIPSRRKRRAVRDILLDLHENSTDSMNHWNAVIAEKAGKLLDFVDGDTDYNPMDVRRQLFESRITLEPFNNILARDYFLRGVAKEHTGWAFEECMRDYREAVFACSHLNQKYIGFWSMHACCNDPENFKKDFEKLIEKYGIEHLGCWSLAWYAVALSESERVVGIIDLLKRIHPKFEFWKFPKLSSICVNSRISVDERTRKAAAVFQILQNFNNNFFINLVKDRDVAVVGNSSCEKGLRKGRSIDSYELIVRFNDFSTDAEYLEDYGHKTDIWMRMNNSTEVARSFPKGVKCIILDYAVEYFTTEKSYDDILVWSENNIPICIYPKELVDEIYRNYALMRPTSGIKISYWLSRIKKKLNRDDFFGFSFTDQLADWDNRNYFKLAVETMRYSWMAHNWHLEKRIFAEIIKGDSFSEVSE